MILGRSWIIRIMRRFFRPYSKLSRATLVCRGVPSLLALAWLFPVQVLADVWKYVDEKGVIHFTNEPPNKDAQQLFQSEPAQPASAAAPVAHASAPASTAAPVTAPAPVKTTTPAPAPTTHASAAVPLNPGKALGDWPPRSLTTTNR